MFDTPPEERFDRLTRLAAALFEVPVALITLVDRDRQWFKSRHGLDVRETPRDVSFCAQALFCNDVMVVPDTRHDSRFADTPVMAGKSRVRFYAGYLIRDSSGTCFGILCLIETPPRDLDGAKLGCCATSAAWSAGNCAAADARLGLSRGASLHRAANARGLMTRWRRRGPTCGSRPSAWPGTPGGTRMLKPAAIVAHGTGPRAASLPCPVRIVAALTKTPF